MSAELQRRVDQFVMEELARIARGADGWAWAWSAGVGYAVGSCFRGTLLVDRDRAGESRGGELAAQLAEALRGAHPDLAEPLVLDLAPTTRLDYAFGIVEAEFKLASFVDSKKMSKVSIWPDDKGALRPWVTLGTIERRLGWTADADRIRVQMYADSSGDEAAARQLGETWLAALRQKHPDVASIVIVVGESH